MSDEHSAKDLVNDSSRGDALPPPLTAIRVQPRRHQSREQMLALKEARRRQLLGKEAGIPDGKQPLEEELPDATDPKDEVPPEKSADGEPGQKQPLVRVKRGVMTGGGVAPRHFSRRRRRSRNGTDGRSASRPRRSGSSGSRKLKHFVGKLLRYDSLWLIPIAGIILFGSMEVLKRLPSPASRSAASTSTPDEAVAPAALPYDAPGTAAEDAEALVERSSESVATLPDLNIRAGIEGVRTRNSETSYRRPEQLAFTSASPVRLADEEAASNPGYSVDAFRLQCISWLNEFAIATATSQDLRDKLAEYSRMAVDAAKGNPELLLLAITQAQSQLRGPREKYSAALDGFSTLFTEAFKASATSDPILAYCHYQKGTLFELSGQIDNAMEEYARALRLSPMLTPAVQALYLLHSLRDNDNEVIEYGRRLLQLRPGDKNVVLNVARRLDSAGRSAEALQTIDSAGYDVLGDMRVLTLKLQTMRRNGTPTDVLLDDFLRHAPAPGTNLEADVQALILRDAAGRTEGLPDDIRSAANRLDPSVLGEDPAQVRLALNLAILAASHGLGDLAEQLYRAIIASGVPEVPLAANNLAYQLALEGKNFEEAERLARKATASDPSSETFIDTLATVLLKSGRPLEAVELFEISLSADTLVNSNARKTWAEALPSAGRNDEAARLLGDSKGSPMPTATPAPDN